MLSQRVVVQNPTSDAADQIGRYLKTFFDCVSTGSTLPNGACTASPD